MKKLNELNGLIYENGKVLNDNIELGTYGLKITIKDDDAEYNDEADLFESYSIWDSYDFLNNNGYLKSSK